ncbi:restriction endonuclease [Flavobacterium urocaniciphilum]|uniref:Restriction endonuclease n=1 Tax=Flavobacterium urocaniciphilum TaxID=1299341 RepID=A0A1H9ARF1_9FLAO|nr:restriction endonuclease [Flavobacterium urocaniciphilum]SEP78973.1 Restriction endonuclease [Flavobacterium urocaniciphilum]
MKVTKYSGEQIEFQKDKLIRSLKKSGANDFMVSEIFQLIEPQLYDGIPSKKIYKLAFQYLKNYSNAHAARYNLKSAIAALGPAGFYFEKFIAKIHEYLGFKTEINLRFQGKCVSHEVDIVLLKENVVTMIECKFHAGVEAKSDVKVPMYILSRFNDLKDRTYEMFGDMRYIDSCLIVTNNKFTEDALAFAKCSHLKMLSWDFPHQNGLRDIIDQLKIYPITCLTTLTIAEKEKLLAENIIITKDLLSDKSKLEKLELSKARMKRVLTEVNQL